MLFIFLSISLFFIYFFVIMHFALGWKSIPEEKLSEEESQLFISVIIPFRNEEKNLAFLLHSLAKQTYPHFELILIDDHSTDASLEAIEPLKKLFPRLLVHPAIGIGKKKALKEGIELAKGELLVCTDADCIANDNWLKSIAQYQTKESCDLIIAPVVMEHQGLIFGKLQAVEFASLTASGAGAAGSGAPIMCNAANLAFTPQAWKKSIVDLNEKEVSGDDMFLMLSIKKRKGKIRFLKSTEAIVQTPVCLSVSEFFNQRKRWASKSKSYTDWQVIGLALLVFSLSLGFIVLLIGGFADILFLKAAIFIYIFKTLVDLSLLYPALKFYSQEKLIFYVPVLQIFYPFYVVVTAIGGLFGKFKWK